MDTLACLRNLPVTNIANKIIIKKNLSQYSINNITAI